MYNSGRRGRRANDGYGVISQADKFNQTEYPIPIVTSFAVTDGSYVPLDDTAASTAGGQTIVVYGSGFAPGATIMVGGTTIGSVTYLDQGRLTFTSPANTSGSYTIIVMNANGGTGILVPGLVYSGVPTWSTSAGSVGSVYETTNVSSTFVATGDAPVTYSILSGSLPPGTTLSATGVLSGSAPAESGSTTYSFTIRATDGQLQDSDRSFSLTINTDVVSWSTPTNNQVISAYEYAPISNITASATSAAGYGVVYSANDVPTGITVNANTGVISGTVNTAGNTYTRLTATANTTTRTAIRDVVFNINPDVVTWNTPANNYVISAYEYSAISNVTANATSAAGFGVLYSANTTPTGITLDANTGLISGSPTTVGNTYALLTATANTTSRSNTRNIIYNVNQDVVTWSSPADQTAYSLTGGSAIANVTLAATSAAGKTITYTANALPSGLAISGNVIYGTPDTAQTVTTLLTATANTTNRTATRTISWTINLGDLYWKNTTLLLSANTPTPTFINDASLNNNELSIFGDTRPSNFDPYMGGYYSNYFDGTGDYLSFPNSSNFAFGTGAFTIEFWIYGPDNNDKFILGGRAAIGTMHITTGGYGGTTSSALRYSGSSVISSGSTLITDNSWHHCAIVRDGSNNVTLYVDGVSRGTGTDTTNYTTTSGTWYIASNDNFPGGNIPTTYISNLRIIKGTALYTSAFTPPTAPLTAVVNTTFLTCQSNRLIDNSLNNLTVTKNGDVTVSSAHPFVTPTTVAYNTLYSTYFDGTVDGFSFPTNAAFAVGTGDFTLEAWIYPNALSGGFQAVFAVSVTNGLFFGGLSGNVFGLRSGGVANLITTTPPPTGVWTHMAATRQGTTLRLFINGNLVNTVSDSTNFAQGLAYVGNDPSNNFPFNGFISNVRLVKGTALYTANFTPSTSPLTTTSQGATANQVSLLTCQDSTLKDNSTNNFTATSYGDAKPIAVSPFTMTTSNTTVTSLGSAYFDGTGDFITTNTSAGFTFGTGDFTIEMWLYLLPGYDAYSSFYTQNSGTLAGPIMGTDIIGLYTANGGSGSAVNPTIPTNTWTHIAMTRAGTTVRVFMNGTQIGTFTSSLNITSDQATIGARYTGGSYTWKGYISDVRTIKGTALYTANFLPSQVPLTAVANTQLLTCQTNGSPSNNLFVDQSSFNNLITRNGNVNQGTFSPYSNAGWSYSFPGDATSKVSTTSASTTVSLGSGDYTIEAWCYSSSLGYSSAGCVWHFALPEVNALVRHNGTVWECYYAAGGTKFTNVSTDTVGINQWVHHAVVRSGSTVKWYINGVERGSGTDSTSYSGAGTVTIGNYAGYGYDGFISNFRFVKGTALYTSAFTPPTAPLAPVPKTQLLLAQSNRFIDESFNSSALTVSNNSTIRAFSPFGGITSIPTSYSTFFVRNNNDYISSSTSSAFAFGTNAYTIEGWFYLTSIATYLTIFEVFDNATTLGPKLTTMADGALRLWNGDGAYSTTSTGVVTTNLWYHFAWVRESTSLLKLYINGTSVISVTSGTVVTQNLTGTPTVKLGTFSGYGHYMNGYISNFRITKGQALYTSTFTPSTTPLTTTSQGATSANVSLLTCQSNTMIDNSTNNFAITATNSPKVYTFNPFGQTTTTQVEYSPSVNGGSMYFDGSGDYLTIPTGNITNFSSAANWTVEAWIYPTTLTAGVYEQVIYGSGFSFGGYGTLLIVTNNSSQIVSGGTLTTNQWQHIAAVNIAGSSLKIYLNGVQVGSTSASSFNATTTYVGTNSGGSQSFTGYISDLRVVDAAVYTAPFYPGPAPLTPTGAIGSNIYSSRLLLNGTSGGIVDAHGTNNLETVGDAKVTNFSPYSGNYYSLSYPATRNGQSGGGSPQYGARYTLSTPILGSGDFTIEVWCYGTTVVNTIYGTLFDMGVANGILRYYSTSGWQFYLDSVAHNVNFSASFPSAENRWVHHAIVRSGTTVTWWINGNQAWTGSSSTNFTYAVYNTSSSYAYAWVGYQNHRVVKGTALYNASSNTITVPTTPFTNVSGTVILLNGNSLKEPINSVNPTVPGDLNALPKISTFNPFQQNTGKSLYFDGTDDYLYSPTNQAFAFGTGDFTVEFWFYPSVINLTNNPILDTRTGSGSGSGLLIRVGDGGTSNPTYMYAVVGTTSIFQTGLVGGSWQHIAVTRASNTCKVFINGVAGTSGTSSTNLTNGGFLISKFIDGSNAINGYLSDFRITKGYARYTTNFTPPTTPLTLK